VPGYLSMAVDRRAGRASRHDLTFTMSDQTNPGTPQTDRRRRASPRIWMAGRLERDWNGSSAIRGPAGPIDGR
jgi:hypothetical protein